MPVRYGRNVSGVFDVQLHAARTPLRVLLETGRERARPEPPARQLHRRERVARSYASRCRAAPRARTAASLPRLGELVPSTRHMPGGPGPCRPWACSRRLHPWQARCARRACRDPTAHRDDLQIEIELLDGVAPHRDLARRHAVPVGTTPGRRTLESGRDRPALDVDAADRVRPVEDAEALLRPGARAQSRTLVHTNV